MDAGLDRARELTERLAIPGLASFGFDENIIAEVVPKAQRASSMRYNPVKLSDEALAEAMRGAL